MHRNLTVRRELLTILTGTILAISAVLLGSSGLRFLLGLQGDTLALDVLHSYGGFTLIGLSATLAFVILLSTRHPLYEYWLAAVLGALVGVTYAV